MGQTDELAPSSLALADDGGDLKVSAIPHAAVADLCVSALEVPNAAGATLTAMTVPSGDGAETWAPLLASVAPDRRTFRTDLMAEHRRAVRTGAVGGVALSGLFALLAGLVVKSMVGRLIAGIRLATDIEPARLLVGLAVGLLVAKMV